MSSIQLAGEGYRGEPSIGETNDSAASSPNLALPHTNKTLASGTNLSSKFPVNPLQVNTAGTIPGDSSGHPTNTSPIKRRASQAEELLKAQDAGGMNKIQIPFFGYLSLFFKPYIEFFLW